MTTVTKHEDAVMKMGFYYFRDSILKTLNIHYEFVDSKPTEAIEIHIDNLYMDYNLREQRVKVCACTRPWRLPR